jgi:hypothetical protein
MFGDLSIVTRPSCILPGGLATMEIGFGTIFGEFFLVESFFL